MMCCAHRVPFLVLPVCGAVFVAYCVFASLCLVFVAEVLVAGSPRGLVVFEWCAPRAEWFVERRARSRFVTVSAVLLTVRFVAQSSRVLCTFGIVFALHPDLLFCGRARFAVLQLHFATGASSLRYVP